MSNKKSSKSYRDNIHKKYSMNYINNLRFFEGLQNYELFSRVKKYLKGYKNIFEVGCAPGNYLVRFSKRFELEPFGIEYSPEGYEKTKSNFKNNNLNENNIILGDFFDDNFLEKNKEKYDVVYSLGFIEHFTDPSPVISRHFDLAKSGGLVIICIPNLKYLNKLLTKKDIIDIHNLDIMDLGKFKNLFKNYNICEIGYYGGLFNVGLFFYKNKIIEIIRLLFFILQRVILDPIFILLYKLGINCSNKYTSPGIFVICRK